MSTQPRSSSHFLITGAGTGIGRAIALRLARDNHRLTLLGRNEGSLQDTAVQIRAAGGAEPYLATADIRNRGEVDRAINESAAAHGLFTGVIANSGIGGPNEPGPDDRFDDLVQTNLVGTYSTLRAVQRNLSPGPGTRHMVVIASILARFGVPGYTGYCASKAALLGLTRALALELASENVQVNAICPGWVNTEMARQGIAGMADGMGISYDAALAEAMKAVPLGRMSEPHHIAGLVAYLVGPDGVGITGQGLDMNNGAWM